MTVDTLDLIEILFRWRIKWCGDYKDLFWMFRIG